jgi:hypothetical protein
MYNGNQSLHNESEVSRNDKDKRKYKKFFVLMSLKKSLFSQRINDPMKKWANELNRVFSR